MKKRKPTMEELRAEKKRLMGLGIDAEDIQQALDAVVIALPESPDKDYWTNPNMTAAAVEQKYGLKRFKPQAVEVTKLSTTEGAGGRDTGDDQRSALLPPGASIAGFGQQYQVWQFAYRPRLLR